MKGAFVVIPADPPHYPVFSTRWDFRGVSPRNLSRHFATLPIPSSRGITVFEDAHSFPKQSPSSAHNFGLSRGILESLFAPVFFVSPLKWKRAFGLTSDKSDSVKFSSPYFSDPLYKSDHDLAEALLLALYPLIPEPSPYL